MGHTNSGHGDYFGSVVEASPDCIRILSLDGRVEFMNERGRQLCEIDDFSRFEGIYWSSIWPPVMRPQVEEALRAAAAGETRSFRGLCPTAKGGQRWWDVIVSAVRGPEDTGPVRLLVRSRDITEELRTRSLLDTIVRNVPVILFAKEAATGRYVLMNRATESLFALGEGEGVGKTAYDLFSAAHADQAGEVDRQVLASGQPQTVEEQVVTATGPRWFRNTKVAVQDREGVCHLVGIAEDITDAVAARETLEQALERAESANRAKSEFLATISHEIRTPLNGVLGMAHAMAQEELPPAQRERLRLIRRSGETLLAILNDVLDLSKIEAGKLELETEDFDLEHLARGAAAAFAAVAAAKALDFEIQIDDAAKGSFRGDPTRIRRLLYNLLSNAVKFTDKGAVELTIRRRAGAVLFEVADTGIGIAPAQLPSLFDKFVQGDASFSRRFGGSGLGLSICRGLVDLMGGSIVVSSDPSRGSVFTVSLPLVQVAPVKAAAPAPSGPPVMASRSSALRVLAAEDNEMNQLVLKVLLTQAGIEPHMVGNGLEAVEAWEAERWDLILMDIQMPELDGIAAAQAIRDREASTGRPRTPIIALTANAMSHQADSYRAAGMDWIVSKPIRPETLFDTINEALQASSSADVADHPVGFGHG